MTIEAPAMKLKFVHTERDRHGNVKRYFRRKNGPRTRLLAEPDTPEFMDEYRQALAQKKKPGKPKDPAKAPPAKGTLRWLCVQYFASSEFKLLDPKTQATRRLLLESCLTEKVRPDSPELYAGYPLEHMTHRSIKVLRDRKLPLKHAANDRLKALKRLFVWGSEQDLVLHNPAREVSRISARSDGHHSWTREEIAKYEEVHAVGTKARLAMALLLYTGQRRSDVVLFGHKDVKSGSIRFTQYKNRNRNPVTLQLPILPELQAIIDRSPVGMMTFLVTDFGKPFTGNGFGNKFRQWCNDAGLRHCSAHGLRKAAAAIMAENGATASQLMAWFGWMSMAEAERYTKGASQKKLAAGMPALLTRNET